MPPGGQVGWGNGGSEADRGWGCKTGRCNGRLPRRTRWAAGSTAKPPLACVPTSFSHSSDCMDPSPSPWVKLERHCSTLPPQPVLPAGQRGTAGGGLRREVHRHCGHGIQRQRLASGAASRAAGQPAAPLRTPPVVRSTTPGMRRPLEQPQHERQLARARPASLVRARTARRPAHAPERRRHWGTGGRCPACRPAPGGS